MSDRTSTADPPLDIAVIGSGISGLSAAWLLASRHRVTLFEVDHRLGGHSNTVLVPSGKGVIPVDTGFIVYNEPTYPNLTALFRHLDVETQPTDMTFSVSIDGGRLEYAGSDLFGLFAQPRNLVSPRFYGMLADLVRFYREATRDRDALGTLTLGEYLDRGGYGRAFRDEHLYPMAAAIWSTPAADVGAYPAAAFIRFCDNHGLLRLWGRPVWRTVRGGSRRYVAKLAERLAGRIELGRDVRVVARSAAGVVVHDGSAARTFDRVLLACHADQALSVLGDAGEEERRGLGAFRYGLNTAYLHGDAALMPKRRRAWAAWNYLARGDRSTPPAVTYWMNRLQGIDPAVPLFVTLNPPAPPAEALTHQRIAYHHPLYDHAAVEAQRHLWSLQGRFGVWFAGAYFGAGFHEDGLQAGLAAAEAMGGVRRPWTVPGESGRIVITAPAPMAGQVAL